MPDNLIYIVINMTGGIEDIQYLRQNCDTDNTIIYIDSGARDRVLYPQPSYYRVTLDTPIKYVYGIEILDATIPRSMYLVDSNNDTAIFYTAIGGEESIVLPHQDYTLDTLIYTLNQLFQASATLTGLVAFPVSNPSSDTSKIFFSFNSTTFYFLAFKSSIAETLGFDEYSIVGSADYTQFTMSDPQYAAIIAANTAYQPSIILARTFRSGIGKGSVGIAGSYAIDTSYNATQNMQTPGMVNLTGDRFIRLRSEIIEQHMQSPAGLAANNTGIGLFKLGVTGYSDNRLDYVSVKMKPFHPIGKFSQIDFRFELIDGTLYDFKGVNHHFLLSVKYYIPIDANIEKTREYILNPNYNPDFIRYKKDQYDKDDSDSDSEDIDQRISRLMEREKEYDSDEDHGDGTHIMPVDYTGRTAQDYNTPDEYVKYQMANIGRYAPGFDQKRLPNTTPYSDMAI